MIFFLPFCRYHGLLSLLGFRSIIKWLPVIHIWHEMCNHKSFYFSQANCSKIILLLQTTEEKKKKKKVFPEWMQQSRSAWAVSGVTLYNCTGFVAQQCVFIWFSIGRKMQKWISVWDIVLSLVYWLYSNHCPHEPSSSSLQSQKFARFKKCLLLL